MMQTVLKKLYIEALLKSSLQEALSLVLTNMPLVL